MLFRSGGEGEPPQMAAVLKNRGYGVEFAIARTGVIFQFADPLLVDTADTGGANARSVGIEVVSYGMRDRKPGWLPPRSGASRTTREVKIHGRSVQVASFFPAQLASARALAEGLSRALQIPRRVPLTAAGVPSAEVMPPAELARFRGHVGHYHVTNLKCDLGPDFMAELHWYFVGRQDRV